MDLLSAALDRLRLRTGAVERVTHEGAWTWRASQPCVQIVLVGGCRMTSEPFEPELGPGDVIVATEAGHALAETSRDPVARLATIALRFEAPPAVRARLALPPVLLLRGRRGVAEAVEVAVREALRTELADPDGGTDAIACGLAQALVALALRRHVWRLDHSETGLLRTFAEPLFRDVLGTTELATARVGGMAASAGRSRRAFSRRFVRLTGVRAGTVLRDLRIARVAQALEGGRTDLAVIAREAGYANVPALCRAFRRETGASPAEHWRATHARPFPRPPRRRPAAPAPSVGSPSTFHDPADARGSGDLDEGREGIVGTPARIPRPPE